MKSIDVAAAAVASTREVHGTITRQNYVPLRIVHGGRIEHGMRVDSWKSRGAAHLAVDAQVTGGGLHHLLRVHYRRRLRFLARRFWLGRRGCGFDGRRHQLEDPRSTCRGRAGECRTGADITCASTPPASIRAWRASWTVKRWQCSGSRVFGDGIAIRFCLGRRSFGGRVRWSRQLTRGAWTRSLARTR